MDHIEKMVELQIQLYNLRKRSSEFISITAEEQKNRKKGNGLEKFGSIRN